MALKRKKFELGKIPSGGKSGKFKGKVPMNQKFTAKIGSGRQTFQLGKLHSKKGGSLGKLMGQTKVNLKIYQDNNGKVRIKIPKRVSFNIKKATRK